MKSNKEWKILSNLKSHKSELKINNLIPLLLKNRGLITKKQQDDFLHPNIKKVTPKNVGIKSKELEKAIERIKKAIKEKQQIIVFGDYDVDGIAGTAILWETLNFMNANVMPYIPHRVEEGYGLSQKGIENILINFPKTSLIITVDNGIVANKAIDFANKKNIDVIITDHHTLGKNIPKAYAIIHTTKLCGTGVAWLLSKNLKKYENDHLALVALATVSDLVPLLGANRDVLVEGLRVLQKTKRPGIIEICKEAGIRQEEIGVYEIGHIIAPRINAMGRIAQPMDSLRLLCTKDKLKAKVMAEKLSLTNKDRQQLTFSLSEHAIGSVKGNDAKLLFVAHKTYDEGVIGLVAGKLVESYYKPSIVVAIGEKISKASARSIAGFNIIDFIRGSEHLLINAGGHPMAAGFTVETEKIVVLKKHFEERVGKLISSDLLIRKLKIDCELPLEFVNLDLHQKLQILSPFGMGNPEPVFLSKDVMVANVKTVGRDNSHLKLELKNTSESKVSAIAFGMGERLEELRQSKSIDIAYSIDENIWNSKKYLQLRVKDIK